MSIQIEFHTVHSAGGSQGKGVGNSRATVRISTQKEAIAVTRSIAINQKSEVVIHGANGQIRAKGSYGNDPYPPKG